jgi:hypothetical protein
LCDQFGYSVSISGNAIVVVARNEGHTGAPSCSPDDGHGKAYVFEKPGSDWLNVTELLQLTALGALGTGSWATTLAPGARSKVGSLLLSDLREFDVVDVYATVAAEEADEAVD